MKHRSNSPAARARVRLIALVTCTAGALVAGLPLAALAESSGEGNRLEVPGWAFPVNPPDPGAAAAPDGGKLIHLTGSRVAFTEAQLVDLFAAPDWYPDSHPVMPKVVAHGNPPEVYACGYCHSPTGQGRPENASLAGLPTRYIIQQLADFKSGARHAVWTGHYRPGERMIHVAIYATTGEIAAAAQYFSVQTLKPRVVVVERSSIPQTHIAGWVYVADKGGAEEPLGERLMELAPDIERHEHRDDTMRYVAYVPPGSIRRGQAIARSATGAQTIPCISCHGERLQGVGLTPPIAGRSPTYILRQLLAFKTGARAGVTGAPMQAVVANLQLGNMIDLAAYAASLAPDSGRRFTWSNN